MCSQHFRFFFYVHDHRHHHLLFTGYCRRRSGCFKSVNYRPSSACKMWNLCGLITIWFVVRAHRMFIICLCSWFMCETAGTLELWIMWGIEVKIRELHVNNFGFAYENIVFLSKNLRNSKAKYYKLLIKSQMWSKFPKDSGILQENIVNLKKSHIDTNVYIFLNILSLSIILLTVICVACVT